MGTSSAGSATVRAVTERSGLIEADGGQGTEQPRDFHFAVTWVALFNYLDPIRSTGPRPRLETQSTAVALVPVVMPLPVVQERMPPLSNEGNSSDGWEMVVPRMIRTGTGVFAHPESPNRK
jgi:hypothetical protein